jgi:hypothetical protein
LDLLLQIGESVVAAVTSADAEIHRRFKFSAQAVPDLASASVSVLIAETSSTLGPFSAQMHGADVMRELLGFSSEALKLEAVPGGPMIAIVAQVASNHHLH